jgi:hypothetical protein
VLVFEALGELQDVLALLFQRVLASVPVVIICADLILVEFAFGSIVVRPFL